MTTAKEQEVADQIRAVLNEAELEHGTVALLLVNQLARVLINIDCKECRRELTETIVDAIPLLVEEVMRRPGRDNHALHGPN